MSTNSKHWTDRLRLTLSRSVVSAALSCSTVITLLFFSCNRELKLAAETELGKEPTAVETKQGGDRTPHAIGVKSAVETKPVDETKSVTETKNDKPAETKSVAETTPEKLLPAAMPVEEDGEKQYKQQNGISFASKTEPDADRTPRPCAVPILSEEEASALSNNMKQETADEKTFGLTYFREDFLFVERNSVMNSNRNVCHTANWFFSGGDGDDNDTPASAQKADGFFEVASSRPLKFSFVQPLYEYATYAYTVSCRLYGKGTVKISSQFKESSFNIDSKVPCVVSMVLGDASSFNDKIYPSISFQGDLGIEHITIYQKKIFFERTICFAEVEDISNVPDINKSNYPDCFYTAKISVKQIIDGDSVPQDIQLLIPAFLNKKIHRLSRVMKTGNYKIAIRPFSLASKEEQEIEQVDEIESFLHPAYVLIDAVQKGIPELHTSAIPILQSNKYCSPFDNPINSPLPDKYLEDSENAIKQELSKVTLILESPDDSIEAINERFQADWTKKQKEYNDFNATVVWAKVGNSFFGLPKQWTLIHDRKISEKNIEALKELNNFFRSQGIVLIIQVIPDPWDISALVLNPDYVKYSDRQSATVVRQLLENGIEAQFLSDSILCDSLSYERLFFYPRDYHPGEGAMDIITTRAAERLKSFGNEVFPQNLRKELFSFKEQDTGYGSDYKWPENCDIGAHIAGTNVQTPYIFYDGNRIAPDPASKILVFGNSFIQEPFDKDAYISYLAKKMLYVASSKAMGGVSALTALPNLFLLKYKEYMKDKVVAVLPIGIEHLTNEKYCFTNIKDIDLALKNSEKTVFSDSLPLDTFSSSPKFPSYFKFSGIHPLYQDFILNHTGIRTLYPESPELVLSIPEQSNAKTLSLAAQPSFGINASLLVNGVLYGLSSTYSPNWQVINIPLKPDTRTVSIKLNAENNSGIPFVFIGNVSLYE